MSDLKEHIKNPQQKDIIFAFPYDQQFNQFKISIAEKPRKEIFRFGNQQRKTLSLKKEDINPAIQSYRQTKRIKCPKSTS